MTLPSQARVAVFYAPEPGDLLSVLGASWLGRDAEKGIALPQPGVAGIEEITAEPRLYGLHATLKPPMRVRSGLTWDEVLSEAELLAFGVAPFPLPALEIADLDGFLALREAEPSMALQALADLCVTWLDPFRAPSTEDDLARRRRARLSQSQDAMLRRYGYPYVFGAWRFHITLTRRLLPDEHGRIEDAARGHLEPALGAVRRVRSICLFCQPEPGAPFLLAERLPLRG